MKYVKSYTAILFLLSTFVFPPIAWSASVNINLATAQELTQLNGVGIKKAQAIVAFREKNGDFQSINDLQKVKGVGPKLVDKNQSDIKF